MREHSTRWRAVLSVAQVQDICHRYRGGEGSGSLGRAAGLPASTICDLLKRNGVPRRDASRAARRLALNEGAFAETTPHSLYWAGFLLADGSIVHNAVQLALSTRDHSHIEAFRAFLHSTHALRYMAASNLSDKPSVRLSVKSSRLVNDLARFGMVGLKTVRTASVNAAWSRDFWRGIVDADGWVGLDNRRRSARLELVGSERLVRQFLEFVGRMNIETRATVRPHKSIFRAGLSGESAKQMLGILYRTGDVALERKAARAALLTT